MIGTRIPRAYVLPQSKDRQRDSADGIEGQIEWCAPTNWSAWSGRSVWRTPRTTAKRASKR